MKLTWRDLISTLLVILGVIAILAKLQSYSWWLIGSWKGALAVVGVLGLGILLTNIVELIEVLNASTLTQMILWLVTATVAVGSLFSATTRTELLSTSFLIGLVWLTQTVDHILIPIHRSNIHHSHKPHQISV